MKKNVLVLESGRNCTFCIKEKIAIIMALYYEDGVNRYLDYLSVIPEEIDVFVISSNPAILDMVEYFAQIYKNVHIMQKENRGRDLSALLVAFRPYVKQYDYICFLHDKKSKHASLDNDLNLWIENLWGNLIGNTGYIQNVIELFRKEKYGVLLPPKPIGEYMDSMYGDPWDNDYEYVVNLAKTIHIGISIDRKDRAIVSLGSAFWGRVKALDKLLVHDWKYDDFPEEPMPNDGTLSHAIERILGFVALDEGYKVAEIMNSDYAAKLVTIFQDKMQYTYDWLWQNIGIKNTYQLSCYEEEKEKVENLFVSAPVYLYGAGDYGIQYYEKLTRWGYKPRGFVVSDGEKKNQYVCGLPVKELSDIEDGANVNFIIATSPALQEIIASKLEQRGFLNFHKAICM